MKLLILVLSIALGAGPSVYATLLEWVREGKNLDLAVDKLRSPDACDPEVLNSIFRPVMCHYVAGSRGEAATRKYGQLLALILTRPENLRTSSLMDGLQHVIRRETSDLFLALSGQEANPWAMFIRDGILRKALKSDGSELFRFFSFAVANQLVALVEPILEQKRVELYQSSLLLANATSPQVLSLLDATRRMFAAPSPYHAAAGAAAPLLSSLRVPGSQGGVQSLLDIDDDVNVSQVGAAAPLLSSLREPESQDEAQLLLEIAGDLSVSESVHQDTVIKLQKETVTEHPIDGTHPTPGSKVIRRTWDQYVKAFSAEQTIILWANHQRGEDTIGGFMSGCAAYRVDICKKAETNPDAVLDISNPKDLAYFPDNAADRITCDLTDPLSNEIILRLKRVLKRGGRFYFPAGYGAGLLIAPKRELPPSQSYTLYSPDGRFVTLGGSDLMMSLAREGGEQPYIDRALRRAETFFGALGFDFRYDPRHHLFILTKR